jgi:tetratricopeptide (TPR) repeat protein
MKPRVSYEKKRGHSARRGLLALGVIAAAAALQGARQPSHEDLLWQHRNLGKAFYENPTTQKEAVAEFRKALDLNPGSVRERLNYGLALLRAEDRDEGVAQLEAVQKQDPSLPHTWFNLGVTYKTQGNTAAAIVQFQGLLRLDPNEPVSHYNLGVLYRQSGDLAGAVREFETAARLDISFAAPRFQLYSAYRSLNRPADGERVIAEFRAIKAKQDRPDAEQEDVNWSRYAEIYDPSEDRAAPPAATAKIRFRERALQGTADPRTARILILDFDGDGRPDALVWSDSGILLYRSGTALVDRGLSEIRHVLSVAAGDYDNDGLVDLSVVTPEGALLFHNSRASGFELRPLPAAASGTGFRAAIWVDYDHDRDLDLILAGERNLLLRNDGDAGWEDRMKDFPFAPGVATRGYAHRTAPDDTKAFDVTLIYDNGTAIDYRDRLNGRYEGTEPHRAAGEIPDARDGEPEAAAWNAADFRGNGRLDRVLVTPGGRVQYAADEGSRGAWLTITLEGVKSLKIPTGAVIEVKAGTFYERRWYDTAPITFDLGDRANVDAIRIIWPNGMIQNEVGKQARRSLHVKEAPRLSGSCPMIFTWNGSSFEFITDVLGVAPLGASSGDGTYFPVDHDEYVSIPGSSLASREGSYEIHVTEELNEVSYLDEVQLLALDHPTGTEIFSNEKWKGPPYPDFRLYGVKHRLYPKTARDERGHDVLAALLHRDRLYVSGFSRDAAGIAEMHTLDLDFGTEAASSNRAVLVLNGWVDWADGSTFLKAAQTGRPLVPPMLQVRDVSGAWKTVIEDMGMPSGKSKTIAVDLTGKFLTQSREIRIVTNMCVYWDEIFLGEDASPPESRLTPLDASAARLHFRGFSRIHVDPERKQPESFDYDSVSPLSNWNPTPGRYTRYGDVRELVREADDRPVVMGSGDELELWYDAGRLPSLPPRWSRDFLLLVDGWAKDADANTAFSQTVEPLPFHGMSRYPYSAGEAFPSDSIHSRYLQEFNTRPALRLIRPLKP